MSGDGYVMLAAFKGCQTYVTAGLAGDMDPSSASAFASLIPSMSRGSFKLR